MVHRQKVIGYYIVDFYVAQRKIVIELDGTQHYHDQGKRKDEIRNQYLESLGITVLRYSNRDVNLDFTGVCADIWNRLGLSDQPKPSP